MSCGQDGAVYQWDVDEAKRLSEFVQKGTAYSCALRSARRVLGVYTVHALRCFAEPFDVIQCQSLAYQSLSGTTAPYCVSTCSTKDSVFTVGNDRMLKELEVPDLQVVKELNAGVTLGQIAISNSEHIMFAGTSEGGKPGCVRAYSFPLTGDYLEVHVQKQWNSSNAS